MIKIPAPTNNEKANKIITTFINNRLLEMMNTEFELILDIPYSEVNIDNLMFDKYFAEEASMFFPRNYPINKVNQEYLGLYKLMLSKEEYDISLIMQYILAGLIEMNIEINEDAKANGDGDYNYESIPDPDRAFVKKVLEEELIDIVEEEGEEKAFAEHLLQHYEDLHDYSEVCFDDWDHLLLDNMTEEELVNSELGKTLGIIASEDITKTDITLDGREVHIKFNNAPWITNNV